MYKKNHFKNYRDNNTDSLKNDLHRQGSSQQDVFDDLEAVTEPVADDPIVNLDVETLEDELQEDVVDSKDENVLPDEQLAVQLKETKEALEKEKKEYLFLMADFDNFRKRVVKEKSDLIKNASEKVLKGMLPIVDDFERGLQATKDTDDASAVREGMELIYNKLIKYLAENGVKPMETENVDFNADLHEAIASVPTGDESKKGKIIDTTQKGYTLNDKVLRHAKVVVGE